MRFQIVYMKRGFPLTTWANNADRAHQLAEQLRRAGYSVDVWRHTEDGSRKTDICPRRTPWRAAPNESDPITFTRHTAGTIHKTKHERKYLP